LLQGLSVLIFLKLINFDQSKIKVNGFLKIGDGFEEGKTKNNKHI